MSSSVVARAIRDLDEDPHVQRALQVLFNLEISAGESRTQYKKDYLLELQKIAGDWEESTSEN